MYESSHHNQLSVHVLVKLFRESMIDEMNSIIYSLFVYILQRGSLLLGIYKKCIWWDQMILEIIGLVVKKL